MNPADQLSIIREQIQKLETERASVTAQPRSRQQVSEYVRDGVRAVEPIATSQGALTLERLAAGHPTDLLTVGASAMTPQGPVHVKVDLLPVLVRLLGVEAVRKALLTDIEAIPKGLPPEARDYRLEVITTELQDLEFEEEKFIRDAALTGQDIPRRAGAQPAVVLALEVDQ